MSEAGAASAPVAAAARYLVRGTAEPGLPDQECTEFAQAKSMAAAVGKAFALVLVGRATAQVDRAIGWNWDGRRTSVAQERTVRVGQGKAPRGNQRHTRGLVHVVGHIPGTQAHMAGHHTLVASNQDVHMGDNHHGCHTLKQ